MRTATRSHTLLFGRPGATAVRSAYLVRPIGVAAVPMPSWQAVQRASRTALALHQSSLPAALTGEVDGGVVPTTVGALTGAPVTPVVIGTGAPGVLVTGAA